MYHKLARGYATQYLQSLQPFDRVDGWFDSRRCTKALVSFEESARSKKPGRCVRRLKPLIGPTFRDAQVAYWLRSEKMIGATAFSAAPETQVFDIKQDEDLLFAERSVFLSDLYFTDEDGRQLAKLTTIANMSHHALTRILEREVATPETLGKDVNEVLSLARNVGLGFQLCQLSRRQAFGFMVPYKNGALPIVTMKMNARSREAADNRWVMSVRTFLSEDMLGPRETERLNGFNEAVSQILEEHDHSLLREWLERTGLPWTLAKQTAVSDQPAQPSFQYS